MFPRREVSSEQIFQRTAVVDCFALDVPRQLSRLGLQFLDCTNITIGANCMKTNKPILYTTRLLLMIICLFLSGAREVTGAQCRRQVNSNRSSSTSS